MKNTTIIAIHHTPCVYFTGFYSSVSHGVFFYENIHSFRPVYFLSLSLSRPVTIYIIPIEICLQYINCVTSPTMRV